MSRAELPKSYSPARTEAGISARWEASGAFHAEPPAEPPTEPSGGADVNRRGDAAEGEPYCILIPPPNVTAALHLGHAFNNTLQDVLIRHHRMRGFNTLWMPGTDHAGIATQTVVEKRLMQTGGKKRTDYTRDEFIAKVQAWKDEYEATIIEQLKAMGCSCDFQRTRFTMDEVCAKAVREAFFRLFREGLIYRGKRLVNWDPVTQTALADDEVEMREVQGKFCYLRYPLVHASTNPKDPLDCEEVTWSELAARGYPGAERMPDEDNAWLTVATTRPETYLGDTAVAAHPDDPRAASLRGLMAQLPLVGRVIPIIEDEYVVMPDPDSSDAKAQYATGFLKVTPAHDPNDYEIGQRHDLPVVNVLAPDATISDQHGWEDVGDARLLIGLSREEARKKVVAEFKSRGLLERVRDYTHSVGHSYRSHVPIEPYLSDQWYVRVTDDRMKGEALRAMARLDGGTHGQDARATDHGGPGILPGRTRTGRMPVPPLHTREGDGELRFFPERYAKTFQQWHENLRDWCISRQLWWGHRIPVWHKRVTLTEENWPDELLKWGWDDYVAGNWRDEGIDVRVVRVDGGAVFDASSDPLIPVVKETEGEYDIFICMRDEECFLKSQISDLNFEQDPDVLDTWFSSGLWPLSTMGWPAPEDFPQEIPEGEALLDTFNPSSVLCTAREIITLWVSRMVMFNRYFRDGKLPFRHVYIHAMIQDGHGQKMSKSLGNGVDPRDIIHGHGADALRFTLTKLATATQDVRLPVDVVCPHCGEALEPQEITTPGGHRVAAPEIVCPHCRKKMVSGYGAASGSASPSEQTPLARNTSRKFDEGRNFANKLWNAARFALGNLAASRRVPAADEVHPASRDREGAGAHGPESAGTSAGIDELALADRWILARLHRALGEIGAAVAEYQFHIYAERAYDFVWRDFCDWYLEAIKPTVRESPAQQAVLHSVLDAILRLLHPIMPFVTEALWPHVREAAVAGGYSTPPGLDLPPSDLAATAGWPATDASLDDGGAVGTFERVQGLIEAIRAVRGERNIPPKRRITLMATVSVQRLADEAGGVVEALAGLDRVEPIPDQRPAGTAPLAFEGEELLLSDLVEAADSASAEAERARLERFIAEREKAVAGFRGRLANENYVRKAPAHLVEETKQNLAEAEADLAAARRALESLGAEQSA